MQNSIKPKLSNENLLSQLKEKSFQERKLTVEIIELLQEVSDRDLHLQMGYGSLLKFCVEELKYSEAAAYRRISALRLIKDVPEAKQALTEGSLTLQAASQAQTFLNQEKKHLNKKYSLEQKRSLIQEIQSKSTRQIEQILAEKSPELPRPEKSRQITESTREVRLTISQKLDEKLTALKSHYSHKNQNPTTAELLELMADELLQRKASPAEKTKEANHAAASSKPRYISVAKRNHIRLRDQNRCSYQDLKTGRYCHSQHMLEIDHIQPVSLGGSNDIQNLRLLCRAHNQMLAKEI